MDSEKRIFTRLFYKMTAEFEVSDNLFRVEEISNLSIGGCLLKVAVKGAVGDNCRLKIILGPEDNYPIVTIEGKISRIDQDSTAVRFIEIDPENLEHLQKIVRYNSSDPEKIEQEIKEHPGLF